MSPWYDHFLYEATAPERRRRHEQHAAELQLDEAIALARTVIRPPQFYSRDEEKLFHDYYSSIVAHLNEQIRTRIQTLEDVLANAQATPLASDRILSLLKSNPLRPSFPPHPELRTFLPSRPNRLTSLLPWTRARHAEKVKQASQRFQVALSDYNDACHKIQQEWQDQICDVEAYNRGLLEFIAQIKSGNPEAVRDYHIFVLETSPLFPQHIPTAEVAFGAESKHLVIDYYLPEISIIPEYIGLHPVPKTPS